MAHSAPSPSHRHPDGRFSLQAYRQILDQALKQGYRLIAMLRHFTDSSAIADTPTILLRHDVDLALEEAVRVGEVEAELGVEATYFVRLGSPRYDPLSRVGQSLVLRLVEQGHEIGLHTEANLQPSEEGALVLLRREKGVLESVLGEAVEGVAVHMPRRGLPLFRDHRAQDFGFTYEAYSSDLMRDCIFLSDSNRRWKPHHPNEVIGHDPRIYLSTHPYWWVNSFLSEDEVEQLRLMLLAEAGIEE